MQKNKIMYVIGGLVVVGIAIWVAIMSRPVVAPIETPVENQTSTTATSTATSTPETSSTTSTTSVGPKTYTLTDVAAHKNGTSCWSAVNGGVYDLTSWIAQHPGGEGAILSICGKDGSAAFNGQHGGERKQASVLATYKIGELAK